MRERNNYFLTGDYKVFKKMIIENVEKPILFYVADDANIGDYRYMNCDSVEVELGQVLDCNQEIDELLIYTDKKEFYKDILEQTSYLINSDKAKEEVEKQAKKIFDSYEKYWRECLIIYIG